MKRCQPVEFASARRVLDRSARIMPPMRAMRAHIQESRPPLPETAMAQGNVLFVTLDQLRADCVAACAPGSALAAAIATPALDRLAAEGCAFRDHWTNAVPCGPARASLLTGLYAFNHRVIRNGAPLAAHHATLGTELRKLGVEPLLFGYADQAPDPGDLAPGDPDLTSYEQPARGFREIVEMRFEAPLAWIGALRARGYALPEPLPERVADLYAPQAPADLPRAERLRAPALYRAEDSDTAFLTDRTLEALDARRDGPWFAHVAYIRPHPPFVAPAPYNRLVDAAALASPQTETVAHPFVDAWFSAPAQFSLFHGFDGIAAASPPTRPPRSAPSISACWRRWTPISAASSPGSTNAASPTAPSWSSPPTMAKCSETGACGARTASSPPPTASP
jgi:arylsulfatase A-like enzyme